MWIPKLAIAVVLVVASIFGVELGSTARIPTSHAIRRSQRATPEHPKWIPCEASGEITYGPCEQAFIPLPLTRGH